MHHPVGAAVPHQRGERLRLRDVHPRHAEVRIGRQPRRPQVLQRDVVIGVEVINPDHGLAALKQPLGDEEADEARGPGDDDGHVAFRDMRRL